MEEDSITTEAIQFIRKHRSLLIENFASLSDFPATDSPVTIIMAGSPGAGKTEFTKALQKGFYSFYKRDPSSKIVRIDADDIREIIPEYSGTNAHLFQKAAAIGVEKLIDQVMHKSQNAIIDGTFAHYASSIKNISRSLDHTRQTEIYYLYQDPRIAWDFTQKREAIEKRRINKTSFIDAFFASLENIRKAKEEFKDQIKVNIIIKDRYNNQTKDYYNVGNVDNYVKVTYNREELEKILV